MHSNKAQRIYVLSMSPGRPGGSLQNQQGTQSSRYNAAESTSVQASSNILPDLDLSYMSSPAYKALTSRGRVPTIYVSVRVYQLGELDVISDSCLILGAVRLRQCVSRGQELIISIPRKFAEFQSWR